MQNYKCTLIVKIIKHSELYCQTVTVLHIQGHITNFSILMYEIFEMTNDRLVNERCNVVDMI